MDLQGRDTFERRLARALGKLFAQQFDELMNALGNQPDLSKLEVGYFEKLAEETRGVLQPSLEAVFLAQAKQLLDAQSIGVEWATVNERAARWAREYSFELVRGINDKTRKTLQEQISGFFTDKRTLADLEKSIAELFGPVRAEMIAVTETTRAAVQGELQFADELGKLGLRTVQVWQTANDDTVCPICGPLNQKKQGDGWHDPPPAHPRCRCWTSTEVVQEAAA